MSLPADGHARVLQGKNGSFHLEHNGWTYDLAPPPMVKMSLPPYVEGLDWFVREARKSKGISSSETTIRFSSDFFPGCDASIEYSGSSNGGWNYSVTGESSFLGERRHLWICPHAKLYFDEPPKRMFISVEEK
jgi:hypothetical protein